MRFDKSSVEYLSYKYNSDGIRTQKSYAYPGTYYNDTDYYFRKNLQGDIECIYSEAGGKVVTYTYDAWGNTTSITGTMASTLGMDNPFRYRGYYYDTETGLYYLKSRYYDPQVGRFLNVDEPIFVGAGGTLLSNNLYAYCENNPVKYIDDLGEKKREPSPKYGTPKYNLYYNMFFEFSGLIYSQSSGDASKLLMGHYNGSYNGCSWIAIYNSLLLLGDYKHPAFIIYYLDTGILFKGKYGAMPWQVTGYLESIGYKINTYIFLSSAKKDLKIGDVCIILAKVKGKSTWHYMAMKVKGRRGHLWYCQLYNSSKIDHGLFEDISKYYDIKFIFLIK